MIIANFFDLNTQLRIKKEHDLFILYWTSAKRCADRLEISTRWHPAKRQHIDFHSVKSRMFHNFLHGVSCSNIFTFSNINFLIENWFSKNCIMIWEKKFLSSTFYKLLLWSMNCSLVQELVQVLEYQQNNFSLQFCPAYNLPIWLLITSAVYWLMSADVIRSQIGRF